eukprot:m.133890 g.133890  ORF g.133890 m.133890 type:complete len:93 (+) comp52432_c0_seq1:580-858(+)
MNAGPHSPTLALLTSSFLHSSNVDSDCTSTFTGFGVGPGTTRSPNGDGLIDHILLSGFASLRYTVHLATRKDGSNRRLSDHCMISALVQLAV